MGQTGAPDGDERRAKDGSANARASEKQSQQQTSKPKSKSEGVSDHHPVHAHGESERSPSPPLLTIVEASTTFSPLADSPLSPNERKAATTPSASEQVETKVSDDSMSKSQLARKTPSDLLIPALGESKSPSSQPGTDSTKDRTVAPQHRRSSSGRKKGVSGRSHSSRASFAKGEARQPSHPTAPYVSPSKDSESAAYSHQQSQRHNAPKTRMKRPSDNDVESLHSAQRSDENRYGSSNRHLGQNVPDADQSKKRHWSEMTESDIAVEPLPIDFTKEVSPGSAFFKTTDGKGPESSSRRRREMEEGAEEANSSSAHPKIRNVRGDGSRQHFRQGHDTGLSPRGNSGTRYPPSNRATSRDEVVGETAIKGNEGRVAYSPRRHSADQPDNSGWSGAKYRSEARTPGHFGYEDDYSPRQQPLDTSLSSPLFQDERVDSPPPPAASTVTSSSSSLSKHESAPSSGAATSSGPSSVFRERPSSPPHPKRRPYPYEHGEIDRRGGSRLSGDHADPQARGMQSLGTPLASFEETSGMGFRSHSGGPHGQGVMSLLSPGISPRVPLPLRGHDEAPPQHPFAFDPHNSPMATPGASGQGPFPMSRSFSLFNHSFDSLCPPAHDMEGPPGKTDSFGAHFNEIEQAALRPSASPTPTSRHRRPEMEGQQFRSPSHADIDMQQHPPLASPYNIASPHGQHDVHRQIEGSTGSMLSITMSNSMSFGGGVMGDPEADTFRGRTYNPNHEQSQVRSPRMGLQKGPKSRKESGRREASARSDSLRTALQPAADSETQSDGPPQFYAILRRHRKAFSNGTFLLPGLKAKTLEPFDSILSSKGHAVPLYSPVANRDSRDNMADPLPATPEDVDSQKAAFLPEPSATPTRIKKLPDPTPADVIIGRRRVATAVCAFGGGSGRWPSNSKDSSIFRSKDREGRDKEKERTEKLSKTQIKYEEQLPNRYFESQNRLSWDVEEQPPVEIVTDDEDGESSARGEGGNKKPSADESDGKQPATYKGRSSSRNSQGEQQESEGQQGSEASAGSRASTPNAVNSQGQESGDADPPKMRYRCKLCGQPKQNHTCPYQQSLQRSIGTTVYPALNAFTSHEPGMLAPALSEMNNFTNTTDTDSAPNSGDASPARETTSRGGIALVKAGIGHSMGNMPSHHRRAAEVRSPANVTPETFRSGLSHHQRHPVTPSMKSPGSGLLTATPFNAFSSGPGAMGSIFGPGKESSPDRGSAGRRLVKIDRQWRKKTICQNQETGQELQEDLTSDLLMVDKVDLKPEQFRLVTVVNKGQTSASGGYRYPPLPLPYLQRKKLSDSLFTLSKEIPGMTDECAIVLKEARESDMWDMGVAELLTQVLVVMYCPEGDNRLDGLQSLLLTLGFAC